MTPPQVVNAEGLCVNNLVETENTQETDALNYIPEVNFESFLGVI
jgi:hypothetical protein